MDIKKFQYPKPSFCTKTNRKLLAEAEKRGFYNGDTEYNKLFNNLFFNGGELKFKPDLDKKFKQAALPYLKSFMASFEPKHEEKEAISALLLSELVVV